MAKYTDPNTGVKYSTHTGLKVFTVLVVILLIVSIVLNVVLYTQNSDGEMNSNESGEICDDGEDGEEGKDGETGDGNADSSEGGWTPEPGEGIVDTETIIKNEYAERTSEFDEYGAATCRYYYPDQNWLGENGEDIYGCAYCEGPCEGHEYWITKSGAVYSSLSGWYIGEDEYDMSCEPVVKTQVLTAEDGSTDINSKVRVSLVFDRVFLTDAWIDTNTGEYMELPYDDCVEYTDYYYDDSPKCIEISSLTGEPLEIESVELRQYVYYEMTYAGLSGQYYEGYRSKSGKEIRLYSHDCQCPDVTTVYDLREGCGCGYYTFSLTLSDENTYSFDFWWIDNQPVSHMLEAEIIDVD